MAVGRSDRILVNGYNLAFAMNKIEVKSTREKLDATSLADSNRIYESGFRTGTATTEGFFDSNTTDANKITDVISAAFESGTQEVVSLGYGLYALGGPVYIFDGCIANWNIPLVVNQIILTNAAWTSNNGMMRGKWLASSQLNAGTSNGSSVDGGAASSNGGLLHAHVENTDATGISVKVQHSTTGSGSWVDLGEILFGSRAVGGYTFAANPTADVDSIEFNGVTFDFTSAASSGTGVQVKATRALTMTELASVLNASADTDISPATYTATSTGINVSYDAPGTGGNAYTLDTANGGNSTRTGATLSGGADMDAALNQAQALTIAAGTSVSRYTRSVTLVDGGNTVLVSAAFARG